MKSTLRNLSFLIFFILINTSPCFAREEISFFDSLLNIQTDGSVIITETMQIRHEGQSIRRGIYRDLPIVHGEEYQILSVTRNNQLEAYSIDEFSGRYRITTGNDKLLPAPAISVFKIKYIAKNILLSGKNADELYWNIVGDEWDLHIGSVSVKITLPPEAQILQQAAYVGNKNNTQQIDATGNGIFGAEKLRPKQEFTVAIAFNKGIVHVPSPKNRFPNIFVGWLIGLLYFLIIWKIYGRNPSARIITPRFYPPSGFSAAECSFLNNLGKAPTNFLMVHFLQLAHSGFISITQKPNEGFFGVQDSFIISQNEQNPTTDEELFLQKGSICPMELNGCQNTRIINYMKQLGERISRKLENKYYTRRMPVIIAGAIFMLVFGGLFVEPSTAYVKASIITILLGITTYNRWKYRILGMLSMAVMLIIYINFISGMLYLVGCYFIIITFACLMFQPTVGGQRVIEHIKGIKMFLEAAHHPLKPDMIMIDGHYEEAPVSIEDMEELFPYALFLGLEKAWEEKFITIFRKNAIDRIKENIYYSPKFSHEFRRSVSASGGSSASNNQEQP